MRCECAADGLQQRGERMRMRCLQIADTWRTDCNNVANGLQQRGEQFATMLRTFHKCVANKLQQCNIQKTKTILL
ncbi:hypothetical protein [Prevotella pallens]|uniref:hypothetical protein n=1 Tax=Prevotella pallens TaxID=60133 RepID=UPI001CB5B449|nr:hypothetical protein [Prevotella pallens]MBF1504422.1 hypothetical protein [Prevotella pallens]